jgi:hypothetical protein
MDFKAVIARVHEHLEEDRVESAVMGCLRIARGMKDYVNAAIFLRELYPDKQEVARALQDDIAPLKKEAQDYVFKFSSERWLDLHTVDSFTTEEDRRKPEGERRNVFMISVGELEGELQQWERAISDMTLPQGMGEFDTAAFTDRLLHEKVAVRMRIKAVQTIKARLKTRCLNYVIQIERQLELQGKSQGFLEGAQNEVNNFFKTRSDDVFNKLQKAAQLAVSGDAEDCALLLTEVRRALKAAADFFYKPISGSVRCMDGNERLMGEEQYLNRLHEFVAMRFAKATSVELLQAELDHLSSFVRRLNEMASKGVHGVVTFAEAKQGLIGLYFFLFNLCQHLTHEKDGLIAVTVTAE